MLVIFFYKLTKNPFFFGGGGGGGCGGGVSIMYKCLNGTSTLQGIQMCEIILKYMLKYRQSQFMTILSFDFQVCP